MRRSVSSKILRGALAAAISLAPVHATLSGEGKITYHDYNALPLEAVKYNPPSCGMGYAELDLSRITAVQLIEDADCGKCIKVSNAADPSKFVHVLAVDKGGRGLDLSKPSFGEIFNVDDGVGMASWELADASECAGIWKTRKPEPAAPPPEPVVSHEPSPEPVVLYAPSPEPVVSHAPSPEPAVSYAPSWSPPPASSPVVEAAAPPSPTATSAAPQAGASRAQGAAQTEGGRSSVGHIGSRAPDASSSMPFGTREIKHAEDAGTSSEPRTEASSSADEGSDSLDDGSDSLDDGSDSLDDGSSSLADGLSSSAHDTESSEQSDALVGHNGDDDERSSIENPEVPADEFDEGKSAAPSSLVGSLAAGVACVLLLALV